MKEKSKIELIRLSQSTSNISYSYITSSIFFDFIFEIIKPDGSCPETKDAKKVRTAACHHAQSVRSWLHLRGPVQPVKGEDSVDGSYSVILLSSFA